ncbi:hypothetical protein ABB37_08154 [Leptomonas pyrrhocoris]|uniref:Uncharacterized protein n=1 Tax=Leptomonas pyrrhocoris TaxID=157538 RepID=A0A0N1J4F0_LEPPY|nr:hypothetical protein ABB37_08154 [Leptomonas pyrrhocoris]KPA76008.1 hypothetical protein ABB37_08154 [Leptomonas pyrrhocoris]|eukprot:XP_015654447.1 hypothetical protein ABB37_08154 [Leptomonas pyrrhocoris]
MLRLRLSPAPQQLVPLRHFAYCSSAWGAFTSASLSRYFHCTLKETLQGESEGVSAVAPSPSASLSSSAARHGNADAGTVVSTRASPQAKAPSALHYSLELSLPHLPHRSPFTNGSLKDTGRVGTAARNSELMEVLLAPLKGTAEVASREAAQTQLLHPRWSAFLRLCDDVVAAAAARRATPSAPSCLMGVTIPCKEPYFCAAEPVRKEERNAAAAATTTTPTASPLSTIQAAILLFHQHWRVPVMLALNTTVANTHAVQRHTGDESDAAGEADAAGASTSGVEAVVHDFVSHLHGRRMFLVRGDSPATRYGAARRGSSAVASELHTAGDLIRCVSSAIKRLALPVSLSSSSASQTGETATSVQIAVAGYAQGHPLDRRWAASPAAAAAATTANAAFFHNFERDFNAADGLFERIVLSHVAPSRSTSTSTTAANGGATAALLPAVHHLFHTLGRLHAVRQLWLTPSHYSAEARAACTRQLIEEKVLLWKGSEALNGGSGGGGGARVIVTQMLTSADEFAGYVDDVQRALRMASPSSPSSSPISVTVIPGILLPHPTDAHVLLRALYYAKVIPSVRMQRALETYRTDLKGVWRSIATHRGTTEDNNKEGATAATTATAATAQVSYPQDVANGYMSTWPGAVVVRSDADVAAMEAFVDDAHRRAGARFAAAWMAETVDLLTDLQQRIGGAHVPVHFFTMFNDAVDVRLAQLLDAYAAAQQQQQQKATFCLCRREKESKAASDAAEATS